MRRTSSLTTTCPQEVILNLDTTLLVPQSVNLHASCHPKLYLHPRAKASRQLPKMSPGSVLFTNELQSWESDKAASWLDLAKAYGGEHRSRSGTIKIPQDFICFGHTSDQLCRCLPILAGGSSKPDTSHGLSTKSKSLAAPKRGSTDLLPSCSTSSSTHLCRLGLLQRVTIICKVFWNLL